MKISSIGGEFGLIERMRKKTKQSKDVVVGIGDDSAVLRYNKNSYLLFKTDMLVEDVHFSLKYFAPEQIGAKAIEQNVSDIAAMGGLPRFAITSLTMPKNTKLKFVDRLYDGINKTAQKYKISVVGGDLSSSKKIMISIALIGFVEKKYLSLRSKAKAGDLIFCTGNFGTSSIGLELLKRKIKGSSIKKHLEPKSRLDLARKLVKIGVNSMIDVSDGIASEVRHICNESKVGAVIYADKIPISQNTIQDAKKLSKNPLDFALYGGEDFELIFTANKNKLNQLRKYDVSVIGEIVDKKYEIKLIKNNKKYDLKSGFDHFKRLRT